MDWIKLAEKSPPLKLSVLVLAKTGFYWPEVHGKKDDRAFGMYVGYLYDDYENFKNMKIPKIEFMVECGCSGYEHDRENFEVVYWMPLPKLPEAE